MSQALLHHLKRCLSKYQLYQCTKEDLRLLKRIIQEVRNYPKEFEKVGRLLDRKYSDEAVCRRFEKESQQLLNDPMMYAYEPAADWWPRRGAARPYAHIFPRHRRSEFVEDTWEGKDGNTVYGFKWVCPIDALHDNPNKKPLDIYERFQLALGDLKSDPPYFKILRKSIRIRRAKWVVMLIYLLVDSEAGQRPFCLSKFQKWGWDTPVEQAYNERTGRSFAFLTLFDQDPRQLLDLAKEAIEVVEEDRGGEGQSTSDGQDGDKDSSTSVGDGGVSTGKPKESPPRKNTTKRSKQGRGGGRPSIDKGEATKRQNFYEEVLERKRSNGEPMKVVAEDWGIGEVKGKAWMQWCRDQQKT